MILLRLVIDTNIVVSAALTGRAAADGGIARNDQTRSLVCF
jgi:predicted nucleic acid-binding protein